MNGEFTKNYFLIIIFCLYFNSFVLNLCTMFFYLPENNATYTIWGMAWLELPMRVVVSCDKLGRGAHIL